MCNIGTGTLRMVTCLAAPQLISVNFDADSLADARGFDRFVRLEREASAHSACTGCGGSSNPPQTD